MNNNELEKEFIDFFWGSLYNLMCKRGEIYE